MNLLFYIFIFILGQKFKVDFFGKEIIVVAATAQKNITAETTTAEGWCVPFIGYVFYDEYLTQ